MGSFGAKAVDEDLNEWSVAQFKKIFASAQGRELKMKIASGGWWNIDSPYLQCLVRGIVVRNGEVIRDTRTAQRAKIKQKIYLSGDLLHQGTRTGSNEKKSMKGVSTVEITGAGVDYSSQTK